MERGREGGEGEGSRVIRIHKETAGRQDHLLVSVSTCRPYPPLPLHLSPLPLPLSTHNHTPTHAPNSASRISLFSHPMPNVLFYSSQPLPPSSVSNLSISCSSFPLPSPFRLPSLLPLLYLPPSIATEHPGINQINKPAIVTIHDFLN